MFTPQIRLFNKKNIIPHQNRNNLAIGVGQFLKFDNFHHFCHLEKEIPRRRNGSNMCALNFRLHHQLLLLLLSLLLLSKLFFTSENILSRHDLIIHICKR